MVRPPRSLVVTAAALAGVVMVVASCSLPAIGRFTWTEVVGSAPSARWGHVAVLDAARDRMLVFGGTKAGVFHNDVWAFSLSARTWTKLAPTGTGPSPRLMPTAFVDGPRNRMVIIGGYTPAASAEVWALDLVTLAWSLLAPGPSARYDLASAVSPDRAWVYGGFGADDHARDDLWELDLVAGTWRELPAPTGRPPARTNTVFAWVDNVLLVTGGHPDGGINTDTWRYDLLAERWQQLTEKSAPYARAHASADTDSQCGAVWVFGGDNNDRADRLDLLAFDQGPGDTARFGAMMPDGPVPAPRRHSSLVFDPGRRQVIVFGGWQGESVDLGDTWIAALPDCPAFP